MEQAEYAKSDAPKLTPSKTKAKAFIGWVAATNWYQMEHIMLEFPMTVKIW